MGSEVALLLLLQWGGLTSRRPETLVPSSPIDADLHRPYSELNFRNFSERTMAVKSIQLGQVWRQDGSGQDYLVTKVYSEVFAQYALLRPAEVTAPDAPTVKVKVVKSADGAGLPGYTFTQEGSF